MHIFFVCYEMDFSGQILGIFAGADGRVIMMSEKRKSEIIQRRESAVMNNAEFEREKAYQTTMSLIRTLKRNGAVTDEEYKKIDEAMLKKYRPVLGALLSGKRLSRKNTAEYAADTERRA